MPEEHGPSGAPEDPSPIRAEMRRPSWAAKLAGQAVQLSPSHPSLPAGAPVPGQHNLPPVQLSPSRQMPPPVQLIPSQQTLPPVQLRPSQQELPAASPPLSPGLLSLESLHGALPDIASAPGAEFPAGISVFSSPARPAEDLSSLLDGGSLPAQHRELREESLPGPHHPSAVPQER